MPLNTLTKPCMRVWRARERFHTRLVEAGVSEALTVRMHRAFGRRRTMMIGGVLFIIGAALQAGAVHLAMLIVGRIMLGFGVRRTPPKPDRCAALPCV